MKVNVHIMGPLWNYLAEERSCIALPEGATAKDALARLRPPPWLDRGPLLIVVNDRFAEPSTCLREGDRVTFALPVGGG